MPRESFHIYEVRPEEYGEKQENKLLVTETVNKVANELHFSVLLQIRLPAETHLDEALDLH